MLVNMPLTFFLFCVAWQNCKMDQGGLRRNPQDNNLAFGKQASVVGEGGFGSDIGSGGGMHVSVTTGQPVLRSLSGPRATADGPFGGLNSNVSNFSLQRDHHTPHTLMGLGLGLRGLSGAGHREGAPHGKAAFGKPLRPHHPDTLGPMGVGLGDSFLPSLETLADLGMSFSSGNPSSAGHVRELEPISIKTEDFSPAIDTDRHTPGLGGGGGDGGAPDFDLLDFPDVVDLPDSLAALEQLYVANEDNFLPSLTGDDGLLGDGLGKESKPGSSGGGGVGGCNGGGCIGMNGSEPQSRHQQQPGLSLPQQQQQQTHQPLMNMGQSGPQPGGGGGITGITIKTEKDSGDCISLCTAGVIKMENEMRSHCQMSVMDAAHTGGPSASVSSVGSGGLGSSMGYFGYGTGVPPHGMQGEHVSQDQKPLLGLYPPVSSLADSWGRSGGVFGDLGGMQRSGDQVLPSPSSYLMNYNG